MRADLMLIDRHPAAVLEFLRAAEITHKDGAGQIAG
jgi:hypothetical protein